MNGSVATDQNENCSLPLHFRYTSVISVAAFPVPLESISHKCRRNVQFDWSYLRSLLFVIDLHHSVSNPSTPFQVILGFLINEN